MKRVRVGDVRQVIKRELRAERTGGMTLFGLVGVSAGRGVSEKAFTWGRMLGLRPCGLLL